MHLWKKQKDQLNQALRDAFDADDLEQLLRFDLGRDLEDLYLMQGGNLVTMVERVIDIALEEEWILEFLQTVRERRALKTDLVSLCMSLERVLEEQEGIEGPRFTWVPASSLPVQEAHFTSPVINRSMLAEKVRAWIQKEDQVHLEDFDLVRRALITLGLLGTPFKRWAAKQEDTWPDELTVDVLTENIALVYAPYWIIDATGWGEWSAGITRIETLYKLCPQCNGTGSAADAKPPSLTHRCPQCDGLGEIESDTREESTLHRGTCTTERSQKMVANTKDRVRDWNPSNQAKEPLTDPTGIRVFAPRENDAQAYQNVISSQIEEALIVEAEHHANAWQKIMNLQ